MLQDNAESLSREEITFIKVRRGVLYSLLGALCSIILIVYTLGISHHFAEDSFHFQTYPFFVRHVLIRWFRWIFWVSFVSGLYFVFRYTKLLRWKGPGRTLSFCLAMIPFLNIGVLTYLLCAQKPKAQES